MPIQTDKKQQFKLGTTLFSFTNEYWSRQLSFEQLIEKVGSLNLGPGLEVIGFQSIRGFPEVSDDFASRFRDLVARHGLLPSSLAINADVWARRGGAPLSVDETVDYFAPQMRAAAKLGFPVVRTQLAASPDVLERLLPLAEKLNLRMGPELHAPWTLKAPVVDAYRELYARLRSPLLGFIPDFGACAKAWPAPYLRQLRDNGTPAALLELAMDVWNMAGEPQWKRDEFARRAADLKFDVAAVSRLGVLFSMLVKQDPRVWLEIMPQIIHVHCKFYDFDADGNETTVPYDELLPVFVAGGYSGFMSSEWEGHMYSRGSGIEAVQKHHALCRKILAPYAA